MKNTTPHKVRSIFLRNVNLLTKTKKKLFQNVITNTVWKIFILFSDMMLISYFWVFHFSPFNQKILLFQHNKDIKLDFFVISILTRKYV